MAGEGLSQGCVCGDKKSRQLKLGGNPQNHGGNSVEVPVSTWRAAGCVGAGLRGSAAGGGIAGVMPEVGREGRGCPGTGGRAEG